MKTLVLSLLLVCSLLACKNQNPNSNVITYDIDNFWEAYDKIRATKDSAQQYQYLNSLYIKKGSPGLKAFMQRRNYTADSYIEAINNYPLFWASVRENTFKSKHLAKEINLEINKLKQWYPEMKPAKIYFTIGALMSPGTTMDSLVLIGAETAMADSTAVTNELPDWLASNLRVFFDNNPIQDVVLLNAHEYVHTQQSTNGYDLLSQSLYEGVAEFVSVTASGKPSSTPAIDFGKNNMEKVRERFAKEMFSSFWNDWLYNNFDNEFKMRDLGYYIGYAIAEKYYEKTADKKQAIKTLIELDYGDSTVIETFVDQTAYFVKPIKELKATYQNNIPKAIQLSPFENGDQKVKPGLYEITVEFSVPMNTRFRGFEYGPLGESNVLSVQNFIGFSEDQKAISFTAELKPGQRYQVLLTDRFRSVDGIPLKPFLIDVKTAGI